ncbi:MAG: response regulator transcription factor [Bacteroidales bacterium]|nr:response regulator transcription factor [Bacteroidales bacterium]
MNVLIVEDERLAAEKLEHMINEVDPLIKVIARCGSIKESVKWLMEHTADLIFLDIQLSDGISFSIFEQVTINTPVIFTTAYDQYAIRAFQLNSIAYLLKPIRKSDLAESLRKYQNLKSAFTIDFDALVAGIQGREPDFKKRFLIQIGEKIRKVEVSEIAYFYVLEKGVYLKTFTGNSYPVEFTLDRLESILNPEKFFRINRKYVVNMDSIANMVAYSRGRIKLELKPKTDDEFDAIVSVDRSSDFKKWLNS